MYEDALHHMAKRGNVGRQVVKPHGMLPWISHQARLGIIQQWISGQFGHAYASFLRIIFGGKAVEKDQNSKQHWQKGR